MCACVQTDGVDKKNPSRRYVAPEAGVIALMSGRNCMAVVASMTGSGSEDVDYEEIG